MIDEELTFEAFSYYSCELKPQSGKHILAACDDCGKVREMSKNHYHALCGSCAKKGKTLTEAHKAKISAVQKGKKRTEETKARISAAQKGKTLTDEHKANLSASHIGIQAGEKNPAWLGGISFEPYCVKFNEEYKDFIRAFFGNVCFLCGMTTEENGQLLSVHHKDYNKQCGCDGTKCFCVPLCKRCHAKTNSDRDFWEALITEMLQPVEAWE